MGLLVLIIGLIVLLGAHAFVTLRSARAAVLLRLGEAGYRILFSLVSLVGLALIVWGFAHYRQAGPIPVWNPPAVMGTIAIVLMWPASVLLIAAYLPGRIQAAARHPMLAAVKLWAFGHLLANGDLGGMLLFGAFLAWAVYDRIAVKRREQAGEAAKVAAAPNSGAKPVSDPARWSPAPWSNDLIVVVLGTVLFLALGLVFHPAVIGLAVFGS